MSASQYSIFIFRYSQLRRCLKHVEEDWQNVLSTDTRNIMLKFAKKGKRLATISTFVVHACGQLKIFVDLLKSLVQKQWEEEYEMDKRLAEIVEHHIRVRSQLRQCLKHVEEDWQNVLSIDARNIMLKSAKTGKRLVSICGFFMYSGVFTFRTILPLSQKKIVTDQNITIRPLPCPIYLFSLDVQISPIYEILFVIQCITGFVMVSIVTCACGFTAIFVVHACGQLKILINMMKSLVQKQWQEEHEVDKKLAEIVEHQAEKVAVASCELEWYRLPDKKARSIVLLMIMSNTSTKISAGKFVDLSLKTFGDIMKTAGAYFNMLRNVVE
nr:PREDICTED: uncharacterized protein LOC105676653 [Linepithema humile]